MLICMLPEILFLGPDEGTAGYVDSTLHARERGAPWWKSFLTGKSPELGVFLMMNMV